MSETIKIHKGSKYIAVPGDICRDVKHRGISIKMIGLYTYIYNLPEDDWNFSVAGLGARLLESEQTIRRILNALRELGYVTMERVKDECGKFVNTEWHIYDRPVDSSSIPAQKPQKPYYQKPHVEKPHVEKPHVVFDNANDNYHLMISSSSGACERACVRKENLPELTDVWIEELQMMIYKQLRKKIPREDIVNHYEEFKAQLVAVMTDEEITNTGEIRRHFANYIRKRINTVSYGSSQGNYKSNETSREQRQQQYADRLQELLSSCK